MSRILSSLSHCDLPDKEDLGNGGLQEYLTDLFGVLFLRQQQTKQNPRLLRIVHPTSNLGPRIIPHDISSGHLAVNCTVGEHNGKVVLLNNVNNSGSKLSRDPSSTFPSNLLAY